ncbi:hypothetical protein EJ04DRAFT_568208 [Polyplosphaeria fusca]|uniref:Uncharacterized protein n=1 Tax=Polyplosphaeria fusca TaxID=682080 RepID=A0A9P4QR70_9PLEO|nr:hypothetical protein EJ04DRAFT_568208 [Polyplosphaeria fusca]
MAAVSRKPPMGEPGVPRTEAERCVIVCRLRDVFLDDTKCLDIRERPVFRRHWGVYAQEAYKKWQVNRVCWEVLREAANLHTQGFFSPVFEVDMDKHLTFENRIAWIQELFLRWKSTCDAVMRGEKLVCYVLGPASWLTELNSIKNRSEKYKERKRNKQMAGRAAQQQLQALQPSEDRNAEQGSNDVEQNHASNQAGMNMRLMNEPLASSSATRTQLDNGRAAQQQLQALQLGERNTEHKLGAMAWSRVTQAIESI